MRYVALLRGINVGGNTMIKMEALRNTFAGLGFENVTSYINSGNLAFDVLSQLPKPAQSKRVPGSDGSLAALIEHAIETDFGKQVPVMIREQAAIAEVLTNNPYEGQFASHKEMHVLFLQDQMPAEKITQLQESAFSGERYSVNEREIYAHLPAGVADSLLAKGFLDKKLKLVFTGRNWRTVERLMVL